MSNLTLAEREESHIKAFFEALLRIGIDKEEAKRKTAARFGLKWSDVEKIV